MKTVAKNRFLEACEKLLNDKPNKKGTRLQKVSYVGNYKAEVMTVTIERGDKLNRVPAESFIDRSRGLSE